MNSRSMKVETIRTSRLSKRELRLVRKDARFFGLADGKVCVEGETADDVWRRLHDEAGKANPKYFGFDGARNRFLHWFAGGFHSPSYLRQERAYKVEAKEALDATAPVEKAATGSGYGPVLLPRFHINLLSPYEQMWVRDALRASEAASFKQAVGASSLKARVFGIGPLVTYQTKLGTHPLLGKLKYIHEFAAKPRLESEIFMFNLAYGF